MTKSQALLAKARKEALLGSEAGSALARIMLELIEEYEISVSQGLRIEGVIHSMTKDPVILREMMQHGDWWEIAQKYAKERT
jgi:hypothetical protein